METGSLRRLQENYHGVIIFVQKPQTDQLQVFRDGVRCRTYILKCHAQKSVIFSEFRHACHAKE
jgi:hypothetical protein